MNKKKVIIISISTLLIILTAISIFLVIANNNKLKELPLPEITAGARGELGIDKNINESNIDEYLNRPDAVYRDMRMLEDPGEYETIGGDSYLSGYVNGFEVVPLPYILTVSGLPEEVGYTYTGTTLFYEENGTYVANYEESMSILEELFPKDKVIFLMCGGGGYAGMTKNLLISLGWDENKIYNVGGYWYYKGNNNITVKKEIDGKITYDFDSVPYHKIEFDNLTKTTKYQEPVIKVSKLTINTSKLALEEGSSFQLNVIVLPNDAANKELKWTSSDEKIAKVTENGLVKAIDPGTVTITAQAVDGVKKVQCIVNVTKRNIATRIEVDDISQNIEEFSKYNLYELEVQLNRQLRNEDGSNNEEYYILTSDGGMRLNEKGKELMDAYFAQYEKIVKERIGLFNKMLDEEKSFIVLIHEKECYEREYSVLAGAEKILKEYGYTYLDVGTPTSDGDEAFHSSKLNLENIYVGSLAIIKKGVLYAYIDIENESIKDDEELKNWLGKYLNID